jgi:hypothetical protein
MFYSVIKFCRQEFFYTSLWGVERLNPLFVFLPRNASNFTAQDIKQQYSKQMLVGDHLLLKGFSALRVNIYDCVFTVSLL